MENNVISSARLEEKRLEAIIKSCIDKFPDGDGRVISEIVRGYYRRYLDYISTKKNRKLRVIKKLLNIGDAYVPPQTLEEKGYLTAIELEREIGKEVERQLSVYRRGGMPIDPPAEIIELYPKKN